VRTGERDSVTLLCLTPHRPLRLRPLFINFMSPLVSCLFGFECSFLREPLRIPSRAGNFESRVEVSLVWGARFLPFARAVFGSSCLVSTVSALFGATNFLQSTSLALDCLLFSQLSGCVFVALLLVHCSDSLSFVSLLSLIQLLGHES
jgi:hypothetical protein